MHSITQKDIKDLLKKVEMLEAKATIMLEEAQGIKKIVQDILDPENKRAQRAFEKARKEAEIKATVQYVHQKFLRSREKRMRKQAEEAARTDQQQPQSNYQQHLKNQKRFNQSQ